jgi:hypothetical protein
LVRHLRHDYYAMFLYGIVSGIRETGFCTRECADRFQESADHTSDQTTSRRRQAALGNPTIDRSRIRDSAQLNSAIPEYILSYIAHGKKGGKGGDGHGDEYVYSERYPITAENSTTQAAYGLAKSRISRQKNPTNDESSAAALPDRGPGVVFSLAVRR